MNLALRLVGFGFFLFSVESICPNGSQPIPNQDDCVFVIDQTLYYFDVIRSCEALGGIPAKILNVYENAFVFAMTTDLNGSDPYIGVERRENNTWTYADGTPLKYKNWATREPKTGKTTICAYMNLQSGQWYSTDCSDQRSFICSISGGNLPATTGSPLTPATTKQPPTSGPNMTCPVSWVYNSQNGYCYFLQNFTYNDGGQWIMYNWTFAESNCQQMGGHLASIHNTNEDNFIYSLVISNVNGTQGVVPTRDACYYQWAWIGYYGVGRVGSGTWSDGTPVDYIGVGPPFASSYYGVISNDYSCADNRWAGDSLVGPNARYVCKMASH